jgi:putative peptidoglycan lipid II flippase
LLDWGLRLTLMLTLPASLALAMLATPLLSTLFQYGAFAAADVLRTREALVAYSIGLTGLILVKVLAPGFYARQDIRTPVRIALITLALTQLMNVAFIGWIKHAGLALSIGLASCFNAGMLWRGLRQHGAYQPLPGWGRFMLKLLAALIVLGGMLWFASGKDATWLTMDGSQRVLRLTGVVLGGIASYFAALWLLGFRLADFRRRAA